MTEEVYYWHYRISRFEDSPLGLKEAIHVEVGFRCPRCSKELPSLKCGRTMCPWCDLQMERVGDMLSCSEKPIPVSYEEKRRMKEKVLSLMQGALFVVNAGLMIWHASWGRALSALLMFIGMLLMWFMLYERVKK